MSEIYTRLLSPVNPGKVVMEQLPSNEIVSMPVPWRITFDTNPDDCNFQCTMCEQHSEHSIHQINRKANKGRRKRMDFELIRKTLEEMAVLGTREIIPTTMGEPLMYKEFPQIIELCKQLNVKMNLTTNGSFYGRGVKKWAELIVPVTSDVKISWNGITKVTQHSIMKNSDLDKQISNLQHFIAFRDSYAKNGENYCSVTLQLTFMEKNLDEILRIVVFAIDSGVDRVKGHHLWAHFPEIKEEDLRRNQESSQRWNAVAKECREYALSHPLKNGKIIRLENFSELQADVGLDVDKSTFTRTKVHPDYVCPFLGKEAWINHAGRFDPCCAPDEERKSLGDFGNITDPGQSLPTLWKSEKYQELCRNYRALPLCQGCTMRKPPAEMRLTA